MNKRELEREEVNVKGILTRAYGRNWVLVLCPKGQKPPVLYRGGFIENIVIGDFTRTEGLVRETMGKELTQRCIMLGFMLGQK